jgi:hexokinase
MTLPGWMRFEECIPILFIMYMQVQSICRLVLRRSARLAASLLVAVLRLQDWFQAPRRLVVAVDGGVFLKCTNWRKYLTQYLGEAFGG